MVSTIGPDTFAACFDGLPSLLDRLASQPIRWIGIVIVLAGMLSACANVSRIEKGPLTAHGELLDGATEPLYYSIWIDATQTVDNRTMGALVKLAPDAPPLPFSDLQPEAVSRYLKPFTPPPQWPDSWKRRAAAEKAFAGGGFHIRFKSGRLLSVGICSHCAVGREYPSVGIPDGRRFYQLPLTEQQFTDVFGPPDRKYKVNEVRY